MMDIPSQLNSDDVDTIAQIASKINLYRLDSEMQKSSSGDSDIDANLLRLANYAMNLKLKE
jgi:hypothetical protein